MTRLLALLCLMSLLFGCSTTPPVIKTVTVEVPVTKPCPVKLGPQPIFPADTIQLPYPQASAQLHANPADASAKAHVDANVYYLLKIFSADSIATRSWIDQLNTALKGCTDGF